MKRTLATWIGGVLAVLAASAGDVQVVLDGTNGAITIFPTASAIRDFSDLIERQRRWSNHRRSGGGHHL